MSFIVETFLKCDGPLSVHVGCQDTWGVDSRYSDRGPVASFHRLGAKEAGWKKQGSYDYCPACWAALKQKQNIKAENRP